MIFGEDDPQPPHQPPHSRQQQVRLDASSLETIYANSFALASSADEITVYLGVNSPLPGMKQPTVKVSHRVILIPQNAKRLALVLQQAVKAYEDRFGPIELPPPPHGGQPG
ncbi:MAG: DUF3467 domain-containing protein [Phycisphaerae bacterium]